MKVVWVSSQSKHDGQAIILIALSMIALLAFMVLAIDGGKYFDRRRTSQNASDAASLAGMYAYQHNSPNKNQNVLTAVNAAAEKNGIADTNGVPGDATNTNVQGWWIDSQGRGANQDGSNTTDPTACSTCQVDNTTNSKPPNANGIRVRTFIPYTTFLGQMVGQKDTRAQADGTSL